jgi:hypothetical protein
LKAGAHSTRIDCLPRTTYKDQKIKNALTQWGTDDKREPLRDESANAEEASAQSLPGYEEGNLGGKAIPSVPHTYSTALTSDADNAFFIQKSIFSQKFKRLCEYS